MNVYHFASMHLLCMHGYFTFLLIYDMKDELGRQR